MDMSLASLSPIPPDAPLPAGHPVATGGEGGFAALLLRAAVRVPEIDPAAALPGTAPEEAAASPAAILVAEPPSARAPEETGQAGPAGLEPQDHSVSLPLQAMGGMPLPVPPTQAEAPQPPADSQPPVAAGEAARPGISPPLATALSAQAPDAAGEDGDAPGARDKAMLRAVAAAPAGVAPASALDEEAAAARPAEGSVAAVQDRSGQPSRPEALPAASASASAGAGGTVPPGLPWRPEPTRPDGPPPGMSDMGGPAASPLPEPDHANPALGKEGRPSGSAAPPMDAAIPSSVQATYGAMPQPVQGPAPAATAPPAPAEASTPPPRLVPAPPVRQLAPVCIALALGPGQAPRLTVALEPEELGRVEIRIERDAEGEATAVQVTAARPETLALLQRDARELDRALQQAGIPLAEGGLRFGLSGQEQPGGQGGGGGRPRRGPAPPAERSPEPPVRPPAAAHSLLDIAI